MKIFRKNTIDIWGAVVLLLIVASPLYGQLEASKWYFNNKIGVDFSNGSPQVLTDGNMQALEGCASISDGDGNLLFYSNGQQIWNKNHEVMQGGEWLPGHYSSTQGALVMKKPGSESHYYLFTVDRPSPTNASTYPNPNPDLDPANPDPEVLSELLEDDGLNNGLNYVEIDMDADNGNGAVISGINHLVTYDEGVGYEESHKCSEKLTGITNTDDGVMWVVTHFSYRFLAFKIDENGVDDTPVISQVGPFIDPYYYIPSAIGGIKISPDATHLAMGNYMLNYDSEFLTGIPTGNIYLFDFDKQTGEISNPQLLLDEVTAYGVEFSPDGSKLYASEQLLSEITSSYKIYQFDLEETSVSDSKTLINSGTGTCGSLQLAINGKIYHLNSQYNALSCINNPNQDPEFITYTQNDVNFFNQDIVSHFTTGLPNYSQSYFYGLISYESSCAGEETTFSLDNLDNVLDISWDFGDGQTENGLEVEHLYTNSGEYNVEATVTDESGNTRTLSTELIIPESVQANSVNDVYGCDNNADGFIDKLDIQPIIDQVVGSQEGVYVKFYDSEGEDLGENFTNTTPYQETIYARIYRYSNAFCYDETSVNLKTLEGAIAHPIEDLKSCTTDTSGFSEFDTSEVEANLIGDQEGVTVQYYNQQGEELPSPLPNPIENEIKYYETITAVVTRPETGCTSETEFRLVVTSPPDKPEISTIEVCATDQSGIAEFDTQDIVNSLTANEDNVELHFFTAEGNEITSSFSPTYTNTKPFEETIIARVAKRENPDCYSETRFRLMVKICPEKALVFFPKFFTPNQDGHNDIWQAFPAIRDRISKIYIFDRFGKLLTAINPRRSGWDGTYHGNPLPADEYWFSTVLDNRYEIKGHFSLIR